MCKVFLSLLVAAGLLLSCFEYQAMAADWNEAPECVLAAARDGLANYLEPIPPDKATVFGFSSAASLEQIKTDPVFGDPLLLRTITPEALRNYSSGQTTKNLLSDTHQWYVPVLEAGRTIAFLLVEQTDRFPCQAVSFGYTRLAAQLADTLASEEKRENAVLVTVFQAREYFLAYPDLQPDRLHSLKAAAQKKYSPMTDSPDETLDSVVTRLIPVVNANIQQGEGLR